MIALERMFLRTWDAATLVREHPPFRLGVRKQAIFEKACPTERPPRGIIEVSRWKATRGEHALRRGNTRFEVVPGWFAYGPRRDPAIPEWHLNFASNVAFSTYPLPLFAQDEMQVLEHPALMSVYEALCSLRCEPRTGESRGRPSPVLVRGVERRCAIDTAPDPGAGRPRGLYGNAFETAPLPAILAATRVLDPPAVSNILAIEAPYGGTGRYNSAEIAGILHTAEVGFAAVRRAMFQDDFTDTPAVIHSGYWGCGAYGGHRVLMILLQCIAAAACGIQRLVLHAGDDEHDAREGVTAAVTLLGAPERGEIPRDEIVRRVEALGFRWGIGNGT